MTARRCTRFRNNSQFKCYDGMHNWNQVQPAPYDGMYQFPSVTGRDPTTGKPSGHQLHDLHGTICSICDTDPYRTARRCCPPASTWWKWSFLRATNW